MRDILGCRKTQRIAMKKEIKIQKERKAIVHTVIRDHVPSASAGIRLN
jgi:hypothetical protein